MHEKDSLHYLPRGADILCLIWLSSGGEIIRSASRKPTTKVEQRDSVAPARSKTIIYLWKILASWIHKAARKLELYSGEALLRTYRIGLGFSPVADKKQEGDGATPEGDFYVFVKNNRSAYYLSLGVSYPNVEDAERGLRDGLINRSQYNAIVRATKNKTAPPQYTRLGGLIYIHGHGARSDWTWGCVALENEDIKELFDAVGVGTQVTILP